MATSEPKFCLKCGGITLHEWQIDHDSDQDEPQFSQFCLRCEGVEDYFEAKPPEGQTTL